MNTCNIGEKHRVFPIEKARGHKKRRWEEDERSTLMHIIIKQKASFGYMQLTFVPFVFKMQHK
jgi:hypothetical protein